MKWTISRRLVAGFSAVILLFIFIIVLSLQLETRLQSYYHDARLSEQVQADLQLYKRYVVDMETGLRGYLLVGREEFLEPYNAALAANDTIYQRLAAWVSGDSLKETILTQIDSLEDVWNETFASPLIEARRASIQGAPARYEALRDSLLIPGRGRQLMDSMRELFVLLEAEERKRLNAHMDELEAMALWNERLSIILAISAVLIAILIVYLVTGSVHQRVSSMRRLAGAIAAGNYGQKIEDTYHDELTTVVDSLNSMSKKLKLAVDDLEAKNRELDQFAYVTSHDLKAPLRAINNLAEWIAEDIGDSISSDISEKIQLLRGRVHRMENQIQGILAYSRVGRVAVKPEKVDLRVLLQDIADNIADGRADMVIDVTSPELYTERLALDQVLTNLVSNGIKYNDKPRPKIVVTARSIGDRIQISVKDNGPGIEPRYHEKIFQIFQTLQARDTVESTGIGLSIVKKLIESKGGAIRVYSELGDGATFEFTWPAYEDPTSPVPQA